jgi:hypothetical protein
MINGEEDEGDEEEEEDDVERNVGAQCGGSFGRAALGNASRFAKLLSRGSSKHAVWVVDSG